VALRLSRLTDRQLLELRLCDLPVQIKGTFLEQRIEKLYRELDARSLSFRPHIWLSEEWFTPDGVAGFAIPFYLAHPRLMKLERAQMLEVEGAGEAECMRILRHEAGHAIDNAFRLHGSRTWSDTFGSYRVPYPEWYQPQPGSRDYVLNLDAWYAQAHPAEDFAETFAVWLKPGSRWRRQYEGWGALRKLEYVDYLMEKMSGRKPPRKPRRHVEPLSALKKTLREHYRRKRAYYTIHWPASHERNLYRIFSRGSRHSSSGNDAAQFLRHIRNDLAGVVARGTGVHLYTINHIVKHMIVRCRELNLHVTMPEEEARELAIITLTMQVMQVLRSGYHRIPL
jgi:putative zinc-binding metallo-peptidase